MKKLKEKWLGFYNSWTGSFILVVLFVNFVFQSYVIPSGSMKNSLLVGDFVIVNKFIYGLTVPRIPWIEVPFFPDFNNNGHILEGNKPKHGDIVTFKYPNNMKTHFVKRMVAKEGDLLFIENKDLYIHFDKISKEDLERKYIKNGYITREIQGVGIFIKNPYSKDHKVRHDDKITINKYNNALKDQRFVNNKEEIHSFLNLINYPNKYSKKDVGFDFININGIDMVKLKKDQYFMLGDNRENSHDSRFWGPVNYKHIEGTVSFIWLSFDPDTYYPRFSSMFRFPG